jgi:hypothetical protein
MRYFLLLSLYFLVGCATKYIVPGNRFISPESQGGALRGQIEFQQSSANQLTVDTSNGSVEDGVLYQSISRTGFLFSNSFFERFDVMWSHTGSANSLLGGKFQLIGTSRLAGGEGHKLSLVALFGGNEHETDDESVEFELTGKEYLIVYGYRISPNVLPYASFSYASYAFTGKVSSPNPVLNGLEPEYLTNVMALNGGFEFALESFFAKVEASYQQLVTENTKDKTNTSFGYSLGYRW